MAIKSLDGYKLGIILDASQSVKGIAALKETDALANKTQASLSKLGHGVKFGLADQFKTELKEVDKLAGSSKISGVKMGETAGGGFIEGFTSTLSGVIGTAVLPGIGTAAGTIIGNAVSGAVSKLAGPVMSLIEQGIDLNEQLELAKVHVSALTGSEEIAGRHLEALKKLSVSEGLDLRVLLTADQRLEEFNKDVKVSEIELRAASVAAKTFGSGAEGFDAIADSLGLIAEKGELTSKTITKLQKQGIDVNKYLAKAFGVSEQRIKSLIAQNRIRGDVAARLLSEEIILDKGPRAALITQNTGVYARARYQSQMAILGADATQTATGAVRDYYDAASGVLSSAGAQKVVSFIDQTAGLIISKIESAVKATATRVQNAQSIYDFAGEGANAVKGFLGTIKDAAGDAYNAAADLGASAVEGLKSKSGIDSNSPSRKTEEQGQYFWQGFEKGFMRASAAGIPRINSVLDSLSNGVGKRSLGSGQRSTSAYDSIIKEAAAATGVPEAVIRAIIMTEGSGVRAVSPAGAKGLMQLMPGTAARFGVRDPLDPRQNIMGGAKYLAYLMERYKSNWSAVAAAYNEGEGNYDRYGVRNAETRRYVPRFLSYLGGSGQDVQSAGASDTNPLPVRVVTVPALPSSAEWLSQFRGPHERNKPAGKVSFSWMEDDRGFASAVYNLLKGIPTSEKTSVLGQANYSHKISLLQEQFGVTDMGAQILQDEVAKRLEAERVAALAQRSYAQAVEVTAHVSDDAAEKQQSYAQQVGVTAAATGTQLQVAQKLPPVLDQVTDGFWVLTKSATDLQKAGFKAAFGLEGVLGALEQAAGLIPSGGQPTKKRGFFSKVLGFAAPFLSLVPGVGPILSTLAHMGSDALAGNWQGVLTGVATGFSTDGVFRSSPSTGRTLGGVLKGDPLGTVIGGLGPVGGVVDGTRALGGPVRRGRAYVVGEHRPEVFVADSDGWIHPSLQDYARRAGGGGGGDGSQMLAMMERHTAAIERLERKIDSMPAGEVVTRAADTHPQAFTKGFMNHAARDPRVIEWQMRRVAGL
jgi:tape measure domain-containing protein